MPRAPIILLLALPALGLLSGCGGDAQASIPPPALSAVEALDYCDARPIRESKIACFERVARGEDPRRIAQR